MKKLDLAITIGDKFETNNDHKDLVVTNCGYHIEQEKEYHHYTTSDDNQYLLLYLHQGRISLKRDRQIIKIKAPAIILYEPYEIRDYLFEKCHVNERYYVYFKGVKAKKCLTKFKFTENYFWQVEELPEIIPFFKEIIYDFRKHDFDNDIHRTTLLMQILSKTSLAIEKFENSHLNTFDEIVRYMQDNIDKNLSVSELADLAHLSVNTFILFFKKMSGGCTPMQYMLNLRLSSAEMYLTETHLKIMDISNMVGFNDALYFSNFFKKHTGLSPSEFRKKHSKTQS